MPESVKISDLKNRIALCTMHDVVDKDGTLLLRREVKARCWAFVDVQWNLPSFISPQGYAIFENPERPTHQITLRAAVGLDITSTAWVYEERLKGAPRWYKVLGFVDDGPWLTLTCHLVERGHTATPPAEHNQYLPDGNVQLPP